MPILLLKQVQVPYRLKPEDEILIAEIVAELDEFKPAWQQELAQKQDKVSQLDALLAKIKAIPNEFARRAELSKKIESLELKRQENMAMIERLNATKPKPPSFFSISSSVKARFSVWQSDMTELQYELMLTEEDLRKHKGDLESIPAEMKRLIQEVWLEARNLGINLYTGENDSRLPSEWRSKIEQARNFAAQAVAAINCKFGSTQPAALPAGTNAASTQALPSGQL
ncbi:MAG: hypothetical protein CEO22_12 [Candidatus Berkelbacteria bacterium Gr01-1014_85]|uniref:Uncharacterized protein n=1 Tax=Candidatus Berkelbacteria bacterium Gr01-1014_85 TaxID=2017150 RepID=A0A554JE13_9BACT|nr:MAG: hypothetical protein CEO22_12 [Candidatus Berkelbacteria bacterium Gr01-1014_85]